MKSDALGKLTGLLMRKDSLLVSKTSKVQPDDPAEILPGQLFLGSKLAAENLDALHACRITHVVNAAHDHVLPWREISVSPSQPRRRRG